MLKSVRFLTSLDWDLDLGIRISDDAAARRDRLFSEQHLNASTRRDQQIVSHVNEHCITRSDLLYLFRSLLFYFSNKMLYSMEILYKMSKILFFFFI